MKNDKELYDEGDDMVFTRGLTWSGCWTIEMKEAVEYNRTAKKKMSEEQGRISKVSYRESHE